MKITFAVKYELGHSYKETWECLDSHCPECGQQKVWVEDSGGDYYEGPLFLCLACKASGHQWFGYARVGGKNENWQDKQRLEAISANNGEGI